MARLWRAGRSLAEAASALSSTYRQLTASALSNSFSRKYPGGCWLGPARALWYENPTFGDREVTFAKRTSPISVEEIEQMGLKLMIRYDAATTCRTDWMWKRVQWLNPDLVGRLESLLREPGNMYHVSPPAPGAASLCLCPVCVCGGIIIIYCHLFRFPLIYLL